MSRIKTVLVTTDFSDTSYKAFGLASEMAAKFGAKLVLAHVEEDRLPPLVLEYTQIDLTEILKRQVERARQKLEEVAPDLGADVQLEVASGTPHTEIVRLAEELQIDLIVMATHGRGFISSAILGSTTERVLRHAPCPVLIVREPGQH